jgi:hypothetical protein
MIDATTRGTSVSDRVPWASCERRRAVDDDDHPAYRFGRTRGSSTPACHTTTTRNGYFPPPVGVPTTKLRWGTLAAPRVWYLRGGPRKESSASAVSAPRATTRRNINTARAATAAPGTWLRCRDILLRVLLELVRVSTKKEASNSDGAAVTSCYRGAPALASASLNSRRYGTNQDRGRIRRSCAHFLLVRGSTVHRRTTDVVLSVWPSPFSIPYTLQESSVAPFFLQ